MGRNVYVFVAESLTPRTMLSTQDVVSKTVLA